MFLTVLFFIIGISVVLILVLSLTDRKKTGWVQFYAKGKDCGFSLKEIELLRQLAVKSNLENP
ncbi:MAG: PilZ domain-containing protein, partial [Treponema sp.]|nr:PilZ domain-containing protein [Treponema sp.]